MLVARLTPSDTRRSQIIFMRKTVLLALLLFFSPVPWASATTIDPLIWEQMVLDSEFVGIAECEVAGGIVAKYRVVESWKGMTVGTQFTLRMSTNFWGPQFPVTLVGQRFLFTAYKSYAPTRIVSTTFGSPLPLWWRQIPADYRLPLWQGRVMLPLRKEERALSALGSNHADLNAFKKAVDELLSLNSDDRERRLLQALAKKYLFSGLNKEKTKAEEPLYLRLNATKQKLEASASAAELVSELISLAASDPEKLRYSVGAVLSQGASTTSLQKLKSNSLAKKIWQEEDYKHLVEEVELRSGVLPKTSEPSTEEKRPAPQQLATLRTVLSGETESPQFGEAFDVLTRHDPAPVVDFLIKWKNPEKDWPDTDKGYFIGSYFAALCGTEREIHLQKLLEARDPFIKVAGAVYLTIDNPPLGIKKLEQLMELPGDPGVWAALNLARRGHKAAMARALEVFATSGQRGHMSGVPHENLQLRLLILLSNSAAISNVPQPTPPSEPAYDASQQTFEEYQKKVHQYLVEWWHTHQGKIELSDPWLKVLEQQKVD